MKRAWRVLPSTLGHPRVVLTAFALLLFGTGMVTLLQTPTYVWSPTLQAAVAFIGAVLAVVALVHPSRDVLALTGACLAGVVASRAAGLVVTVLVTEWNIDTSLGRLLGVALWLTILTMMPAVWAKHILPWAVDQGGK